MESQLQKFSILDFSLIKLVYFFVGLLVFVLYPKLNHLAWWFYLMIALLSALPLWIHLFSQKGSFFEKTHVYLKTNNSANQVLLFFSCSFFSFMLAILFPIIVSFKWWVYVIIGCVLAIKPLTVSRIW
jgi:Ca2+/Na+ antiporter